MRTRRNGFSLIEVLVVIGVIALLLSLLMPSLSRVREQARTLQCAAKLRVIGQALVMYANANRGHYPSFSNWEVWGGDGTGEDDDTDPGWCEQIAPFMGAKPEAGVYHCPVFPPETDFNYFLGVRWIGVRGEHSMLMSQVKQSSMFILGGECTHQRLYCPPWGECKTKTSTNDCDKDDIRWKCLSFFGEQYGFNAHRAGNNALFADGHVQAFKKFDPGYMTYDAINPGVAWEDVAKPGEGPPPPPQ